MVNGIHNRLFDGGIGKISETLGLGPVGVLDEAVMVTCGFLRINARISPEVFPEVVKEPWP